ncbi:MAG: MM0924 family protein [Pyrinomonadaceae bacterium]
MEDFLKQLMGKQIDVSCGTSATVRGSVVDVKEGILYLRDENERVAYVVIEKIAFVWEAKDNEPKAGFVH